jgi:hypothetical protein
MQQPDQESSADALWAWLQRLRIGIAILFWTYLLWPLLSNLYGFVLPFFGFYRDYLKWTGLIRIVASVVLLAGVWAITQPPAAAAAVTVNSPLRRATRVLAFIGMLKGIALVLQPIEGGWAELAYLYVPLFLAHVVPVLLGLVYLRHLARRLWLSSLGQSLALLACVYFAFRVTNVIISAVDFWQVWALGWGLWSLASACLIWFWGLVVLRRFAGRLALALQGRCMHCEYLLRGLPEHRCPECGRPFLPVGAV